MNGVYKLAEFVAEARLKNLPPRIVSNAKICILDLLGCAIAGSREEASKGLARVVKKIGGPEDSTVISEGFKTSCLNAALINGFFSHVLEFDDVHIASVIHPATVTVPPALALAEKLDASGPSLLEAVIVGYEVGVRLGLAAGTDHYRRWHTTATCGTFGAAAAASKILGLDAEGVSNALNIAATQASGLWEFLEGKAASSKGFHPGMASSNGVLSALLAEEGFIGSDSAVEGDRGYLAATSGNHDPSRLFSELGVDYKIGEATLKPYPCCRHIHPSIDAAIALGNRLGEEVRDVEDVLIRTYRVAVDIAGTLKLGTVAEARFSLPFCVALALTRHRVTLQDFKFDALRDPAILNLTMKTRIEVDDSCEEEYPEKWMSTVEIKMADGRRDRETVNFPKGDPRNPLKVDEVERKFKSLASEKYSEERLSQIVKMTQSLDRINQVRDLAEALA